MKSPTLPEGRGLDVRVDGVSGTIVLRRPDRRNALSRNLTRQLMEALEDLHQQRTVRAVILTGAGTAFCAGSDLNELLESRESQTVHAQWFTDVSALRDLFLALLRFPKPVIAAVNGPALGTGMGLVAACDLAISCPEAAFGFPESLRGLTAGIAVPLLTFRVGAGRASQVLLRGDPISADDAYRIGLVQELVPHDLLWARSHELAAQIARLAPESVALTKRVLNETVGEHLATQLSAAAAATATARTTEVSEEGIRAFLEKRPPDWNRSL
jgi:enoyl-CoA hydratase/carnithine racemase